MAGDLFDLFKQNVLFSQIPDQPLSELVACCKTIALADGQVVYDVNDRPDSLFYVLEGAVRLEVPMPEGDALFLGVAPVASLLGDHEALGNTYSVARVSAMGETSLAVIPHESFNHLFVSEPVFAQALARDMAMSMRMLILAAAHHYNSSAEKKLASLLLHLIGQLHKGGDQGQPVRLDLSQDEIAQMLSTSRQTVNKYLQHWRKQGWIALHHGGIEVLDRAALESLSSRELLRELGIMS